MEAPVADTGSATKSGGPRLAVFVLGAVLAVVLIITGVVSLLSHDSGGQGQPRNSLVGTHVAAFTLPGINGGAVSAPWKAHHAAVLLFFAADCAPCHAELPTLGPAVGTGTFGATRVVGIDIDASPGAATAFVTTEKLRFPVGHDGSLAVAGELVAEGIPATVFVRADGTVQAVHYGALSPAQFRSGLAQLR